MGWPHIPLCSFFIFIICIITLPEGCNDALSPIVLAPYRCSKRRHCPAFPCSGHCLLSLKTSMGFTKPTVCGDGHLISARLWAVRQSVGTGLFPGWVRWAAFHNSKSSRVPFSEYCCIAEWVQGDEGKPKGMLTGGSGVGWVLFCVHSPPAWVFGRLSEALPHQENCQ